MPPTRLFAILSFFLNPQIGQSLICYDCPSYGAECARPGDENFGELLECPDSPRAACVSIHRLTVIRRTHSIINYSLINMRQLQIYSIKPKLDIGLFVDLAEFTCF